MSCGFVSVLEEAKKAFARLENAPLKPVREVAIPHKTEGIYVFYEDGKPLRVGTSRNLRQRVKQHCRGNHRSAAFAKLLARCETGIKGGTRPGEGWESQCAKFSQLHEEFEKARNRVRKMSVRWIEVSDRDVRYLLEFYAAKELPTPYNDFSET